MSSQADHQVEDAGDELIVIDKTVPIPEPEEDLCELHLLFGLQLPDGVDSRGGSWASYQNSSAACTPSTSEAHRAV